MPLPENIFIGQFDYDLPGERIAKYPLAGRDSSKLLLYKNNQLSHTCFNALPDHFENDDMVVFNSTRVIQARLHFMKSTGALIEVFCLDPSAPEDYQQAFAAQESVVWKCLVGNARKWKHEVLEHTFSIGSKRCKLYAELLKDLSDGYLVRFSWSGEVTFAEVIEASGSTPIPPYLKREVESTDAQNYQTVYAKQNGSVAAPTAGLHFTEGILNALSGKGVRMEELVLHVGAGTFIPVKEENALKHEMHAEYVSVSKSFLQSLLRFDGRITAVGTTVTRSLESIYRLGVKSMKSPGLAQGQILLDQWDAYEPDGGISVEQAIKSLISHMEAHQMDTIVFHTRLMIIPGYRFRMVDRLITNFHQPKSTLLLLIAALIGDDWKKVYEYALKNGFRFLSYGDSSLLARNQ